MGETLDTEHALFTVINLDQVWAQLAVTPRDLPHVRVGQRVELTAETAPGRVFTGPISAIGNAADEKTRTVRVRCALANRDGALRPETFVRGHIITDVRRQRVVVPLAALQEHNGKETVYVAKDGHPGAFEVRHVKLGVTGDGWREVASGLQAGEKVAVNGTFYLKSEALKSSLSDACCAVETGK
jgi:RND family efflux transporter MFP subunit